MSERSPEGLPSEQALINTELALTELGIDISEGFTNPVMGAFIDKFLQIEQSKIDGTYGMEDTNHGNLN